MSKPKNVFGAAAAAAGFAGLAAYLIFESPVVKQLRADLKLQAAARTLLASIAQVMSCPLPPLTLSRSIQYAQSDGTQITVNPDWLNVAMKEVCSDAGCSRDLTLGILAHELAHHVHRDVFAPPLLKRAIELRADRFAGVALARLGVSSEAFTTIISRMSEHYSNDPREYPDRGARVAAIQAGYVHGLRGLLTARYQAGQLAALRSYGLAS